MAAPHLQYLSHKAEIDAAVSKTLAGGQYMLGPECQALEGEIARLCGASYGLGVNSGTDALALILAAFGVGDGDEVITTPFTFFATAEVIENLGAVPVFVDIDPQTFNLDPRRVEAAVTEKTKAIMPVHLFGQMADMDALGEIAKEYRLPVIEDAAQALGATFKDRPAGSFGDATGISFFPTKNLGACGDAGMVVTSREEVKEAVRLLRFHGSGGAGTYEQLGVNSRLDDVQAAILRVKLPHLEEWNGKRIAHAARYDAALKGTRYSIPYRDPRCKHIFHHYTLRTPERDAVQAFLEERGVDSRVYYAVPLHRQPVFEDLGYREGDLRNCDEAAEEVLSLPVFPELTESQQDRVINALLEYDRTH
ncbi:MAG: DegT/DnrJ/EryC1/StrS family aminotransferase [Armatimonadetes bacterium]|nr:DegT/DnrJ/EryC1/StrS family aminotransferase [Armatimonadota bacterium]